jgi:DNA-binding transcriptional LysR family regulator
MVEFGLRELQYHQQVHELVNKRIDLGYVGIRFPELESELVFECLRRAAFWVALPFGHRLAKQRVTLRSLQDETFISIQQTAPAYQNWFVNICRSAGFMPKFGEEADGALSLLGLVSAGFGVALVPETFRKLLSVEVEFRPLASTTVPSFDSYIAWHRDNQSSVLKAFLTILKEHVRPEAQDGTKSR